MREFTLFQFDTELVTLCLSRIQQIALILISLTCRNYGSTKECLCVIGINRKRWRKAIHDAICRAVAIVVFFIFDRSIGVIATALVAVMMQPGIYNQFIIHELHGIHQCIALSRILAAKTRADFCQIRCCPVIVLIQIADVSPQFARGCCSVDRAVPIHGKEEFIFHEAEIIF